jgi:hypothetical protein
LGQVFVQFDTILKILFRLKYSTIFPKNTILPDTQGEENPSERYEKGVVGYFSGSEWNLDMILSLVNPVLRDRILTQADHCHFLSWLVHGCLTASIHSPLSFAVSRSLETASGAGGPAARLADLPAPELAGLLWHAYQRVQAGYIGRSLTAEAGTNDLENLLGSAQDTRTRGQLLQRALDALGIAEA